MHGKRSGDPACGCPRPLKSEWKSLNVLLPIYHPDEQLKSFPLIPYEPLEASATIKQGAVEIKDDSFNIREHAFSTRSWSSAGPNSRNPDR